VATTLAAPVVVPKEFGAFVLKPAAANEWYVSPTGSAGNDGTELSPWDLGSVLEGSQPSILPGDTVCLRDGTYNSGYTSVLNGAVGKYITVKSYPGETAVIDTWNGSTNIDFTIDGSYTRYQDLEITSSDTTDITLNYNRGRLTVNGVKTQVINNVIHDLRQAAFWDETQGGDWYGNIEYNMGVAHATQGLGHSLYTQDEAAYVKTIGNNVFFNSTEYHIHASGTTPAVQNYAIQNNIFLNAGLGRGVGSDRSGNALIGTTQSKTGQILFEDNVSYGIDDGGGDPGIVDFGRSYSPSDGSAILNDNYLVGSLRWRTPWEDVTGTGNTVVGTEINASNRTGPVSISVIGSDTGDKIFLHTNDYDAARAHLAIFDWGLNGSVTVDLSSVLEIGDTYEIYHIFDLATPQHSGTYTAPVAITMSSKQSPALVGDTTNVPGGYTPISMGPEIGVFLVLKTN
jgi:hypothetical protein